MSSSGLSRGSIFPPAPEFADGWMVGTSPTMTATSSPLPGGALRRGVRRQRYPGMAALLPHGDGGRGKLRVGEGADGDGDEAGEALALPVDGRAAHRAEVEGQRVAALGRARPGGGAAGEGDLLTGKARLVADHGAGAALALEAVAHGDAGRLA